MILEPPNQCEFLAWDSEFFGFRVARVIGDTLTTVKAAAIHDWCLQQGIHCLYFFSRPDDPETSAVAESHTYHLVDVRVTFQCHRPSSTGQSAPFVHSASAADTEGLLALARANSGDSRFSFDMRFPKNAGARLHERWIEKNCRDETSAVFVVGAPGQPLGYITCETSPGQTLGKIGLLGVASEARNQGVGTALVRHALDWFHQRGCEYVKVVTQARNVAAQRLYQRAGFLTDQVHLCYHKWFKNDLQHSI
jgi:dTDP-4-amino-4,6-dideoxy-D-galactose acyltransferase